MLRKIFALTLVASALLTVPALSAQDDERGEQPTRKPQAELAAKDKSFAKVAPDAPEVKSAKKADDLTTAKKSLGETASFVGTVDRIYTPKGNGLALINFAKNFRTAVIGVVRAKDFAKFPDLNTLKGKKVLITGEVEDYKGQPQVQLVRLENIKLVQ